MKVLYFDCSSGISGNMTLGALMELIDEPDYLQKELAEIEYRWLFIYMLLKQRKMVLLVLM